MIKKIFAVLTCLFTLFSCSKIDKMVDYVDDNSSKFENSLTIISRGSHLMNQEDMPIYVEDAYGDDILLMFEPNLLFKNWYSEYTQDYYYNSIKILEDKGEKGYKGLLKIKKNLLPLIELSKEDSLSKVCLAAVQLNNSADSLLSIMDECKWDLITNILAYDICYDYSKFSHKDIKVMKQVLSNLVQADKFIEDYSQSDTTAIVQALLTPIRTHKNDLEKDIKDIENVSNNLKSDPYTAMAYSSYNGQQAYDFILALASAEMRKKRNSHKELQKAIKRIEENYLPTFQMLHCEGKYSQNLSHCSGEMYAGLSDELMKLFDIIATLEKEAVLEFKPNEDERQEFRSQLKDYLKQEFIKSYEKADATTIDSIISKGVKYIDLKYNSN